MNDANKLACSDCESEQFDLDRRSFLINLSAYY